MADFTAADVKRLRDATGAGMMDCKKALTEADGDYDKAVEFLRVKGAKDVGKRLERSTTNGIVVSKDGALLELDCETDFVAKNADFQALADQILQVALDQKPADLEALRAWDTPPICHALELVSPERRGHGQSALILPAIEKMGRYIEISTTPTVLPIVTIISGSIRRVIALTAASTSSS